MTDQKGRRADPVGLRLGKVNQLLHQMRPVVGDRVARVMAKLVQSLDLQAAAAQLGEQHPVGAGRKAVGVGEDEVGELGVHGVRVSFFSAYKASRASRGLRASGSSAASRVSSGLGGDSVLAGAGANRSTWAWLSLAWDSRAWSVWRAWLTTAAGMPARRATWMP